MTTVDVVVETRGSSSRLHRLAGLPLRGLHAFLTWRRRRQGIRMLLELDDRLLRDAGFTRADVERLG